MKTISIILFAVFHIHAIAQNTNFNATDCSNVTLNSHDVLNEGYVIIIASTGIDCAACQSAAPTIGGIASNNLNRIKIWGAMNFRYSNNTPTCVELFEWRNNYFWNDVFMFVDNTDAWEGDGYPTYYVIEPEQKIIVLTTNSFTEATNTAFAVADTVNVSLNVADYFNAQNISYQISQGVLQLNFNNFPQNESILMSLFDMSGKQCFQENNVMTNGSFQKDISPLPSGIYILQVSETKGAKRFHKKIIVP